MGANKNDKKKISIRKYCKKKKKKKKMMLCQIECSGDTDREQKMKKELLPESKKKFNDAQNKT